MKQIATLLILGSATLLLVSCGRTQTPIANKGENSDPSIVPSEPFRTGQGLIIENGSAFDRASVTINIYNKLILPKDATIRTDGEAGKLQIYMKKTLLFHGHPPEPMSIRQARKNMGCAVKAEKDGLLVATFGEWDSHREGGVSMQLLFVVPKGVDVERRPELSGENSLGREWNGNWLTKPKEVKEGYWYGPATPAEGWQAIAAVPDPERKAK